MLTVEAVDLVRVIDDWDVAVRKIVHRDRRLHGDVPAREVRDHAPIVVNDRTFDEALIRRCVDECRARRETLHANRPQIVDRELARRRQNSRGQGRREGRAQSAICREGNDARRHEAARDLKPGGRGHRERGATRGPVGRQVSAQVVRRWARGAALVDEVHAVHARESKHSQIGVGAQDGRISEVVHARQARRAQG